MVVEKNGSLDLVPHVIGVIIAGQMYYDGMILGLTNFTLCQVLPRV